MRRTNRVGAALCLMMGMHSREAVAQREPAVRPVTVAEAVGLALQRNPDALSSDAQVKEAAASRAGARGSFGPKLHVDANAQKWDSVFRIQFGNQSFTAREAFTWTASVSLVQPITPLFAIYDQYKVQDFGVDVASIRRAATRREVALGVIEAYYRLLEAGRLAQVADASVAQLEAQQKQAQSLFANGVVGKNDLLRAGLALAGAQQRAIQMHGQIELGRGDLATAIGASDGDSVEPIPYVGEPPSGAEASLPSAEGHAVAQRLELRELDRRIDQAAEMVHLAKTKLVPQLNAVGNYTHFDGSPFQQTNAAYVGLFASWDVWDWGTTLSGISEAESRLQQARLARGKAQDEVRLEARRAFVNATTASEALGVARAAVSQAEENYRIVTKRFENAAATSFDVVDAEGLLTQARGQVETALYDLLIAQASLDKATGAPLPGER